MTGRREWPKRADDGDRQPLHSPTERATTAEQARRPIQTSKPKEDR